VSVVAALRALCIEGGWERCKDFALGSYLILALALLYWIAFSIWVTSAIIHECIGRNSRKQTIPSYSPRLAEGLM